MGNIGSWSSVQPSGSSSIRDGDDLIRSDKSVLESAWAQEHFFSGSSTGVHRPGSARPFLAARSSLTTAADSGRLAYASDSGALLIEHPSSSWSTIVGGQNPNGCRMSTNAADALAAASAFTVEWDVEDFDVGGYGSTGTTRITVPAPLGGRHILTAGVRVTVATTYLNAKITRNGAAIAHGSMMSAINGAQWAVNVAIVDNPSATNYYELVLQSGSASSTGAAAGDVFLAVERVV